MEPLQETCFQLKPHHGQQVLVQKRESWGSNAFPMVQQSSWMRKGKWVQQVIARSDSVARWKMRSPGSSWGSWHCSGLGDNWEQPVKRSVGEVGDMGPCVLPWLLCKGTCVAAALHLLLLFLFRCTSTCEKSGLGVQAVLKCPC